MLVYVDDMITISKEPDCHVVELKKTFELLRKHTLKLNLEKYAFEVASGKFLGYMVSSRDIEANPQKIQAVLDLKSPMTIKEVQNLTGRVAVLNQFISRAIDKCHPFFRVVNRIKREVNWTP